MNVRDDHVRRIAVLHDRVQTVLKTHLPDARAFDLLCALTYEVGEIAGALAADGENPDDLIEDISILMREHIAVVKARR